MQYLFFNLPTSIANRKRIYTSEITSQQSYYLVFFGPVFNSSYIDTSIGYLKKLNEIKRM